MWKFRRKRFWRFCAWMIKKIESLNPQIMQIKAIKSAMPITGLL